MAKRISVEPVPGAGSGVDYSASPSFDYVPALDGLRAVSVLMVVTSHAGLSRVVPGGFGVTVFFFISGFLITRQLLAEQSSRGQLALGAFYVRRLLRLYPALLVMLGVGGSVCYALGADITWGQLLAGTFYYMNLHSWFVPYNNYPDGMYHPFAVLWSLAVEEHFYLGFPALVFLLGRFRVRLAAALCLVIAAVVLWRFHVAVGCAAAVPRCMGDGMDFRILQGTDTRLDSILYGAVLATLLGTRLAEPLLHALRSPLCFAAGLGLLLVSLLFRDELFRDTTRFVVQGAGLFLTIGATLFSPRLGWVRAGLCLPPLRRLGRWSYSLYLWHSVVLLGVVCLVPMAVWRPAIQDGHLSPLWDLVALPAVVLIAVGIAALSYTYVEAPMIAVRRRFGSKARRDSRLVAAAPPAGLA